MEAHFERTAPVGSSSTRVTARGFAVLVTAALVFGCDAPDVPSLQRLIEEDPEVLLGKSELAGREPGARSGPADSSAPAPDAGVPRDLTTQAWKVDLSGDVRNAVPSPPGSTIERMVSIPPDAELRAAIGIWPKPAESSRERRPVRFVVSFAGASGTTTLYEGRLDPVAARGWRTVVVDLAAHAGTRGRLRLHTESAAPLDSLPVWANVEIVRRRWPRERLPNVVLISIDTLRADHLSLYGYGRETSPGIDAWARRAGVTFENVVASSPWTLPSHVSLFTGWNAMRHGVNHPDPAPTSLVMLAEVFRRAGALTTAFTAGGYVAPVYGLAQGFDRYLQRGMPRKGELERNVDRVIRFLERNRHRPFFLFLHTYETHTPYRPHEPYYGRWGKNETLRGARIAERHLPWSAADGFAGRHELVWAGTENGRKMPLRPHEVPEAIRMYDSAIGSVDRQVVRVLEHLELLGLADDTLVILTSDHGEAFGEDGNFVHGNLGDETLLVPLVFSWPARWPGGRRIPEQVRLVDVAPTILELAGLSSPDGGDGVSLVSLVEEGRNPPPPEAWSYAARGNYGIALRVANRTKYLYNNTAWKAVQGAETFRRLNGRETLSGDERRFLRKRVRAELARMPGFRVELANAEPAPLTGAVVGSFRRTEVKAIGNACDCIRWEARGELRYAIPSGGDLILVFEGPRVDELRLSVSPGTAEAFEVVVRPGTTSDPRVFGHGRAGWKEWQDRAIPATRIRVWTVEESGERAAVPAPDEKTLKELRALGYVQ